MNDEQPEVLIARRLVDRLGVRPPILVEDIAREYADVEELHLPFEFDGISLFLKHRYRRPKIILNLNRPSRRRRFTLAHELGHVLIPWHVGTIVDQADLESTEFDDGYAELEAQANRFASELLMPTSWVRGVVAEYEEPVDVMDHVVEAARVSHTAACRKVLQNLAPGNMFIHVADDGEVISSGRSEGTIASPPPRGRVIDPEHVFVEVGNVRSLEGSVGNYYWWTFPRSIDVGEFASPKEWRELLEEMLAEIELPRGKDAAKFKGSLNGVIAYANAQIKGTERSRGSIHSACLQRLYSNPDFESFCAHPLFDEFLRKRIDVWFR